MRHKIKPVTSHGFIFAVSENENFDHNYYY